MNLAHRLLGPARGLALGVAGIVLVAACSSTGASATPTAAPASQPPASAPASTAPSAAATGTPEAEVELKVGTAAVGKFLTGKDGMTLYIFKKDTPGKSVCNGDCAANWPPLIVSAGKAPKAEDGVTGALATIKRDDGSDQVTYNGAPLYYFAADKAAGDTTGQGVGDVWFIAAP